MKLIWAAAACAGLLTAGAASAQTIYSNDFDGGVVTGAGVTVTTANAGGTGTALPGGWSAAGWAGNFLRNASVGPITTTSFTFTGIGAHSQISLGGVFGLLDSWDSTNGSPAPDWLEVLIDGNLVATLTTNNASGSVINAAGGTVIALYQQVDSNQFYSDTLIDFTGSPWAVFAHSGSALTIDIRAAGGGWQGGTDESWGLDNFSVVASGRGGPGGVPEPAAWGMMIGGFGLAGAALRRRRLRVRYA